MSPCAAPVHPWRCVPTLACVAILGSVGMASAQATGDCEPAWVPAWVPAIGGTPGVSSPVWALTVFDGGNGPALHAGGQFTSAGGVEANRIAKWDGAVWSPLGSGMGGGVLALTVFDDSSGSRPALYAGGGFTVSPAGDSYLAKWQG